MNKELEKAIYRLKIHTTCAQIINDCCIVNKKDIETVLNHIENSIPKEKVKDIIRKWKEKDYVYGSDHLIKNLQKLLEGK